ncbi:MAG: protein kinase [Sandaracinaceae bacterium]
MTGPAALGEVVAGRYRLEKVLGKGGMGAVYEATQVDLGRPVAIKLLHPSVAMSVDSTRRFQREAKVTAALQHPNVVKIHDFGLDGQRLYLVMERLYGQPLRALVDTGKPPLPHGRTASIGRQVADVLVAAHPMGLVHRDLKPENVFLETNPDGTDRVVVVDFGLAFIEEREDATRMTREGAISGTPLYMSPEQAHGRGVGPASDIYALGCMLYEMVTGNPPFDGPTVLLLSKHCFEPPEPPSRRRADVYVPRALEELVLSMLAKDPAHRPGAPAISQVLTQVEHTLGERERARGITGAQGREARMIPTVRPPSGPALGVLDAPEGAAAAPVPLEDEAELDVVAMVGGRIPEELRLGLRANGLVIVPGQPEALPARAQAVYAPGASDAVIARLVDQGRPVLTDAGTDDMERVARLLEMGVADVVGQAPAVDQLARKLTRALRRAKRRGG